MTDKFPVKRSLKTYAIGGAIALWLICISYALVKNPSAGDATGKLIIMKSDLSKLIENGGTVLYRNESAKFGGALLSILINKDTWTQQLRYKDMHTLVALGWQPMMNDAGSFCKEKMLTKIQEDVNDYKGQNTVYISMSYSTITAKICR